MMKRNVLVIGGTGAMGIYLVPELLQMGYQVDVVSLDSRESTNPDLRYIVGDATDMDYMKTVLARRYDAIVDFMIYHADRFREWYRLLLDSTDHYIYLSSYRVYADLEHPIRETSPRLLDVSQDAEFLAAADDEYSLYKAIGEDVLRASVYRNWTIIRPAITYSSRRFQLVTLEMPLTVGRAFLGKPVVLPIEARNVQGTMSWAGDVGRMIARLVLNEKALGETYTVSTAEHHTWGEIADYYRDLTGMKVIWVGMEDYLKSFCNQATRKIRGARWQLQYDRLYNRIIDNSKILDAVGMKQNELMPLYDGLKREIDQLPRELFAPETVDVVDLWLKEQNFV